MTDWRAVAVLLFLLTAALTFWVALGLALVLWVGRSISRRFWRR